jgi:hypothetical protein
MFMAYVLRQGSVFLAVGGQHAAPLWLLAASGCNRCRTALLRVLEEGTLSWQNSLTS